MDAGRQRLYAERGQGAPGAGQAPRGGFGIVALVLRADELDLRQSDDAQNRAQIWLLQIEIVERRARGYEPPRAEKT